MSYYKSVIDLDENFFYCFNLQVYTRGENKFRKYSQRSLKPTFVGVDGEAFMNTPFFYVIQTFLEQHTV